MIFFSTKHSNLTAALVLVGSIALAANTWAANKKAAPAKVAPTIHTLAVDTTASDLKWVGAKITGQHNGVVKIKQGNVIVDGSKISSGFFEIDMSSISNDDIKDGETNAKLLGHLKSEDFFDVAKFPESMFKIKKTEAIKGAKAGGPTHTVWGDLTIKGVTQPVSFPAKISLTDTTVNATADIKIDRTKWNIKYGSGKFFKGLGDKVIKDEFTVALNLVAKK